MYLFYLLMMSRRRFECNFVYTMTCGGEPMERLVFCLSQTSLIPIIDPEVVGVGLDAKSES